MKLEQQVVSLEPAKQLKKLGVPQDSLFYWVDRGADLEIYEVCYGLTTPVFRDAEYYSAFTAAELGEMLPILYVENFPNAASKHNKKREHYLSCYREKKTKWICSYTGYELFEAETEADARAKCLIFLIENGYTKP